MCAASSTTSMSAGWRRWTLIIGAGVPAESPTRIAARRSRWPVPVPTAQGVALTRWSPPRLADHLAEQNIVQIRPSHLRRVLADGGVSLQPTRTWKASPDPDYEAKAARVLELTAAPPPDGGAVIAFDQMGP